MSSKKSNATVIETTTSRSGRKSSAIDRIILDERGLTVTVQFRDGSVYRHRHVPRKVMREFLAAESKGRYYVQNIRPRPFVKLVGSEGVRV